MNEIPLPLMRAFADRVSIPFEEAARLLSMDRKTLRGHINAGNIRFLSKGLGTERQRREFRLADLLEFLERLSQRECPSTGVKTRRTSTTISNGDVIGFTARLEKLNAEKLKKPSRNSRTR